MQQFIAFIRKEFYHIFRDFRTLIILFGIPIAQIMIFGYVIRTDVKDVKVAVLDQSKDNVTRKISQKLFSSGYFQFEKEIFSDREIEEVFKEGKVKEVIVFGPDFSENLEKEGKAEIQLITDASDPNTANLISNYTRGIIQTYIQEAAHYEDLPYQINTEVKMVYNESLKGVYMFVPGTMALILMLISTLMTSVTLTREKEQGTMEVLLISPLRPAQIIIGKVVPYVLLSFINACIIILLGNTVFGLPINGSLTLLLLMSVLYILLALSLGILISTNAKTQQIAMFISLLGLMLPTILLSGFIFPVENMPKILQYLCYLMPPKYFITLIKDIMLKGAGMELIWNETLILVGMTIFFLSVSIRRFKIRLE